MKSGRWGSRVYRVPGLARGRQADDVDGDVDDVVVDEGVDADCCCWCW